MKFAGLAVKAIRQVNDITLEQLANEAGLTRARVSAIESGTAGQVDLETWMALAQALKVPTATFLVINGMPSSDKGASNAAATVTQFIADFRPLNKVDPDPGHDVPEAETKSKAALSESLQAATEKTEAMIDAGSL